MTTYIQGINALIRDSVRRVPGACVFGQNIDTGTFISGLSRGLEAHETGRIINTPNIENTACGTGFGLMLGGVPAIYFAKQLDFMLLGIDHFYNTYNFIRASRDVETLGSFTIILWVCDQGMQGPHSSFNGLGDICSLARFPGFTLTNKQDARHVLETQVAAPGFRIIGLSSRLGRTELLDPPTVFVAQDASIFQYSEGDDATVVCFNYGLEKGYALCERLEREGRSASLFSVNYMPEYCWDPIRRSVARTRKLVVIDDSKSVYLAAHKMLAELELERAPYQKILIARGRDVEFGPCEDDLVIDLDRVVADIATRRAS